MNEGYFSITDVDNFENYERFRNSTFFLNFISERSHKLESDAKRLYYFLDRYDLLCLANLCCVILDFAADNDEKEALSHDARDTLYIVRRLGLQKFFMNNFRDIWHDAYDYYKNWDSFAEEFLPSDEQLTNPDNLEARQAYISDLYITLNKVISILVHSPNDDFMIFNLNEE